MIVSYITLETSLIGPLLLAATDEGLCNVEFGADEAALTRLRAWVQRHIPGHTLVEAPDSYQQVEALQPHRHVEAPQLHRHVEVPQQHHHVEAPRSYHHLEAAKLQLSEYFAGLRRKFDLTIRLYGTPFQLKVWQVLQTIPYAQTYSYKDVAIRIGQPQAVRAVGGANNKNPIAVIVPCHRVIGASGALVGYGGGLPLKQSLLSLEGSL